MNKQQQHTLLLDLGFKLDLTRDDWSRYILKDPEYDIKGLRLIVYNEDTFAEVVKNAADIIFKAGQLQKVNQFKKVFEVE